MCVWACRECCVLVRVCESVSGVWCVCTCVGKGDEREGVKLVGWEEGGEGGERDDKEAQHEWARSGGQSTSLSAAMPRGLSACPVSQRAVREVPAAWSCCRQLSEMCDSPIVAAPMASPPALAMVGDACLSLWTTGLGGGGV